MRNLTSDIKPTDIGFLATKTMNGFRIWDRGNKKYRIIQDLPGDQDDNFMQHARDVVDIAKRHGILHAVSYAVKVSNAYWAKINSNTPLAGTRIL